LVSQLGAFSFLNREMFVLNVSVCCILPFPCPTALQAPL
jgi:hypothetical protein